VLRVTIASVNHSAVTPKHTNVPVNLCEMLSDGHIQHSPSSSAPRNAGESRAPTLHTTCAPTFELFSSRLLWRRPQPESPLCCAQHTSACSPSVCRGGDVSSRPALLCAGRSRCLRFGLLAGTVRIHATTGRPSSAEGGRALWGGVLSASWAPPAALCGHTASRQPASSRPRTVPWGHRTTRPPTPPLGVESPPLPSPSTLCRPPAPQAAWCTLYALHIYTSMEIPIVICTQVCKICLVMLRNSCNLGFKTSSRHEINLHLTYLLAG
jgi:hypothetical protein